MSQKKRPNILVMLSDDHGQWAANCYGTPEIQSPNMDYLAETGARMAHAFTPTPVCSPARASFFTGRTASQHGIHDWLSESNATIGDKNWMADEWTLYQQLELAGYHVGHFGKWHCGQSHVPQPGVHRWFSLPRNQGVHHGEYTYCDEGNDVTLTGNKSEIITDKALKFLNSDHDDKPWMCFVGLISTHSPHKGLPERLVELYRKTANDLLGTITPPNDAWCNYKKSLIPEFQAQYFASVTEIDEQLGRLTNALKENGELDNTVIVYTSDHGLSTGQLGYWQKGNGTRPLNMRDRSIHIPMLLRYPEKIKAGQVREEPVDLCDLFHSLLDYADSPLKEDQNKSINPVGSSFTSLLSGEINSWRNYQCCEYGPVKMIRTESHKLIRRNGHGTDQLFDLQNDPNETKNSIEDSANCELIESLDQQLNNFYQKHIVPEKSSLLVRDNEGAHNQNEPWRKDAENYVCKGWKSES